MIGETILTSIRVGRVPAVWVSLSNQSGKTHIQSDVQSIVPKITNLIYPVKNSGIANIDEIIIRSSKFLNQITFLFEFATRFRDETGAGGGGVWKSTTCAGAVSIWQLVCRGAMCRDWEANLQNWPPATRILQPRILAPTGFAVQELYPHPTGNAMEMTESALNWIAIPVFCALCRPLWFCARY